MATDNNLPQPYTARPATETDKDFMLNLHTSAYHDVVVAQFGQWDQALQDAFFHEDWVPEKYQVIEINGKPVGCLCVINSPGDIYIKEIRFMPEFQSCGLGTALITCEIVKARHQNKRIHLQVLQKNIRARSLYEKLGFRVYGDSPTHFKMELFPTVAQE